MACFALLSPSKMRAHPFSPPFFLLPLYDFMHAQIYNLEMGTTNSEQAVSPRDS